MLAAFLDVLTRADHVARMDQRIGAKDSRSDARGKTRRRGSVAPSRSAEAKSTNGGKLFDAVHADTRGDLGTQPCTGCCATIARLEFMAAS